MIPITRKEHYLNRIVGNNEYETPEKPISEEEFFFAEILGEAVQAPEPLTRYQMYLAKIAGKDVEITYPETRLEYFLAKAAGMEIETPTPITREEIFWSNYHVIVDFEIDGVPPLTYKAIEGTLENYRIYGNTVGGESVGNLVESGEHAGEYEVLVKVSGTDILTTSIYLPEPLRMVGEETEYVDYEEQKQHRVRKNLLPNTATSQTINGVAFTVNSDGRVTCNGTSTSQYYSLFRIPCYLVAGNYTISGCPVGGSSGKYRADIRISPNGGMVGGDADIGAGVTIPIDESGWYDYTIRIQGGYTVDDVVFKPMIRKADIEDDTYEPYIENTELDVTLPALPTLSGTNILSIGTTMQPSKVYIKGEKEREYL